MKLFTLLITLLSFVGCGYKVMSKEERVQMILGAMIEGYKLGRTDAAILIPPIEDKHLRDMHDF